MDITSRADWGARPPRTAIPIVTPSLELWLHHSADGRSGAAGVKAIQDIHMDSNGWADIAYSFLIDRTSLEVFEGRGAGIRGGHTLGHNTISHGICVLGNFENLTVSDPLIQTIAELVAFGRDEGWWPGQLSGGHRDVRATACPGENLYLEVDEINRRASGTTTGDDGDDDMAVLQQGDQGEGVRRFQQALRNWSLQALPTFGIDGDYGAETTTWVGRFQMSQDLPPTGVIDGITAALLLEYNDLSVSAVELT